MIEPIGLRFGGDGRLFQLTALSARDLVARLIKANRLSKHELSLFELGDGGAPGPGLTTMAQGDPAVPAVARTIRMVRRLRWNRSVKPRHTSGIHEEGPKISRHPRLPYLSENEIRRVESVASSRVLAGAWRLSSMEACLLHGKVPGRGHGELRQVTYVSLFGGIFVVERLLAPALFNGGPRDVVVEQVNRTVRLLRFEGIATARDGGGLVLRLRDRMRLDHAWTAPLEAQGEEGARRFFGVKAVVPEEGFAFVDGPCMLRGE